MRMSGTFERRETAWRWPLLLPVPDLRSVAHVALRGPEHEGPGSLLSGVIVAASFNRPSLASYFVAARNT